MSDKTIALLLTAKNMASGPLKEVKKDTAALGSVSGIAGKGMRTLGGNLKSAFTTPLGLLGITGGLFGLEHILSNTITKAQDWGLQIEKLQGITHDSAESLSGLLAVTEKYGLANERLSQIAGFTEKTLGALTTTAKKGAGKASAFLHQYGFNILDVHGKTKSFSKLLLTFSDYWVKNKNAGQKAAAAAKLFGRGYADLVPVLNLGSKGIKDAEKEAKDLGLTLTQDNVKSLAKAREATRQWGDALGGLELQIGLKLLPRITDMANAATGFVRDHGKEIIGFFDDAATFAGELGSAIHDDVLPVFQKIGDAWGALPEPLKKLLIAGFVANKLSGGAITGIASELGKGLIKGVLGINAGVVNVKGAVVNGGGGPGGAPGGSEPGPKGPGLVSTGAVVLSAVAIGQIGYEVSESLKGPIVQAFKDAFPDAGKNGGGDFVNSALTSIQNQFLPGFDALNHLNDVHLEKIPTELNRIADFLTGHTPGPAAPHSGAPGHEGSNIGTGTGGSPGHEGANLGSGSKITTSIALLQHGAVTAVDNTTAAVNTNKEAVVASQGIAQGFISGAVRTSGGQVANTTARGASNITTQSIGNASRIVGAISASRPIVTTTVVVTVTGAAVTKSQKTQTTYGPGSGSAGNDAGRVGGR